MFFSSKPSFKTPLQLEVPLITDEAVFKRNNAMVCQHKLSVPPRHSRKGIFKLIWLIFFIIIFFSPDGQSYKSFQSKKVTVNV